jgi:proteasome assembly chaperone (PAC2) family protein
MDSIKYSAKPALDEPVLVVGFGGWPNAGEVATSTIDYLVEQLGASEFATIVSDRYYLLSLNRPLVSIANGHLKNLDMPNARFHFWTNPQGPDLILFRGPEPQIHWEDYLEQFLQLCRRFQVQACITLGGLHDEVLHYEERISAAGATMDDVQELRQLAEPIELIDYVGPTAIHSLFLALAREHNIRGFSLWAHAATYLQGTNYKLCAALIRRLNLLLDFNTDTTELELSWRIIEEQIENLISRNEELKQHVAELKSREHSGNFKPKPSSSAKIIHLNHFAKQKKTDE